MTLALPDPTLDFSVEGMSVPARPRRSPYGIGSGEVARLLLALGRRPMDSAPRWLRDTVEPMKRHGGVSRYFLEKSGRLSKRKQGSAQLGGLSREAELFLTWCDDVENGRDASGLDLDPGSLIYAGALPDEFPPFRDKHSPLVARIDAWGRTKTGALVLPSLKCARYGFQKPAWWNGITEAPWYYDTQSQSEMAICNAAHGLLVIGCGWLRDDDDPREDGERLVLRVHRNDDLIVEIREAAEEGWERIQKLRAA